MTTNREKLAKMTDEELAEMLSLDICQFCKYEHIECVNDDSYECASGIVKWLNEECEDGE